MNLKTFMRGIHLREEKELAEKSAIRRVFPEGEMVFPLSQHIGAPARPLVAPGDQVRMGQMIAEPAGPISAAICSSVSGKVKAVEPRLTVSGDYKEAVVIENDGLYTPVDGFGEERSFQSLSREEILSIIRDAGIVGMGGAGFPTAVKLSPENYAQLDVLIINAAECEPYLTSDHRLMLERPDELLGGIRVLLKLLPNARAVIGIEDNKPDAVKLLSEKCSGDPKISVQPLKTKYPQGGERMLIHAVTGRDIHSRMLPAAAGCVVQNVATAVAVYNAVCRSTPLITRVMTISGDGVNTPCNLEVSVGVSHRQVMEAAGGLKGEPEKLSSGGPMMGTALYTLDIPVQKTSASILALLHDPVAANPSTPCIHCGRCVAACPERLVPQMMQVAADHDDFETFEKLHGMECIECGCCTAVCPAHRTLTQSFKYGKASVNRLRREAKAKAGKKA